ncbi:conserved hypothetical protein [Sphingomonas sp. 8AM]|nr:conserved hypothetical protein [Sphingomonas sp. 8AM]
MGAALGGIAHHTLDEEVSFGCQARSSRYPWGKGELRTWTPNVASVPEHPNASAGAPNSPPFQGRLIQAYGEDYGQAHRSFIVEQEDGCRRQYLASFFSDDDNSYIQTQIDQHPAAIDPATYERVNLGGDADQQSATAEQLANGQLHVYETQHFALWYGNGLDDSYDFMRTMGWDNRSLETALQETGEWLEKAWVISRDVINAPMPFADAGKKQKLNIVICGTGRPDVPDGDHGGCGASVSGQVMSISGWAMKKGSQSLAHEFSHLIQFSAGNYPSYGGNIGFVETGANFNSFVISPSFNWYDNYLNQLEYGPAFSHPRYDQHPFMTYLYENDRTRDLVWNVWKALKSANGWSARPRDYIDQVVASGQRSGFLPLGYKSFAEEMGWYGARLVAMDFFNQRLLLDGMRPTQTTSSIGHFHTPLARSGDDPTVYTAPAERSLLEWGTHIIPLTPAGGRVTVTLTGGTTRNQAAWRFALVTVKPGDVPVYSALAKAEGTGSGAASLTIPAGAKAYLAVTATPYKYESLPDQPAGEPAVGTRFPYSVRIEGATPWIAAARSCDLDSAPGLWAGNWNLNGNGGGWWPC